MDEGSGTPIFIETPEFLPCGRSGSPSTSGERVEVVVFVLDVFEILVSCEVVSEGRESEKHGQWMLDPDESKKRGTPVLIGILKSLFTPITKIFYDT